MLTYINTYSAFLSIFGRKRNYKLAAFDVVNYNKLSRLTWIGEFVAAMDPY